MIGYTDIFIEKLNCKYNILENSYIYIDNDEELTQLNIIEPSRIFQGFIPIDLIEDKYEYINIESNPEYYI